MLYNFESETELEIARNWCAGAFGWSRKRLLGEAMAAPFSCCETCFVFASANAWRYPEGEALFLNVPWHGLMDVFRFTLKSGYIWYYLMCIEHTASRGDTHQLHHRGQFDSNHPVALGWRRMWTCQETKNWRVSAATLSCAWKVESCITVENSVAEASQEKSGLWSDRICNACGLLFCTLSREGSRDQHDQRQPSHNPFGHKVLVAPRPHTELTDHPEDCSQVWLLLCCTWQVQNFRCISSVKWWAWNKLKSVQYVEMHSARLWKSRGRRLNPWSPRFAQLTAAQLPFQNMLPFHHCRFSFFFI